MENELIQTQFGKVHPYKSREHWKQQKSNNAWKRRNIRREKCTAFNKGTSPQIKIPQSMLAIGNNMTLPNIRNTKSIEHQKPQNTRKYKTFKKQTDRALDTTHPG